MACLLSSIHISHLSDVNFLSKSMSIKICSTIKKALYEIYVENGMLLKIVVYYKCIYNYIGVFMPTIEFIRKGASINLEYYHDIHSVFWH